MIYHADDEDDKFDDDRGKMDTNDMTVAVCNRVDRLYNHSRLVLIF